MNLLVPSDMYCLFVHGFAFDLALAVLIICLLVPSIILLFAPSLALALLLVSSLSDLLLLNHTNLRLHFAGLLVIGLVIVCVYLFVVSPVFVGAFAFVVVLVYTWTCVFVHLLVLARAKIFKPIHTFPLELFVVLVLHLFSLGCTNVF